MEFVPLIAMAALVFAIINFVKYVKAGDTNGIVTQLSVWAAGVAVVLLVAQTDLATRIAVGDEPLSALNVWSLLFVGLTIGSTGTLLNDFKKAFDNTDSAHTTSLIRHDE